MQDLTATEKVWCTCGIICKEPRLVSQRAYRDHNTALKKTGLGTSFPPLLGSSLLDDHLSNQLSEVCTANAAAYQNSLKRAVEISGGPVAKRRRTGVDCVASGSQVR